MIYELRPGSREMCYAGSAKKREAQELKKMAVILFLMAALCVVYAGGIFISKAAGTRFYLIWFGIAGMLCGAGFFVRYRGWQYMPVGGRIALAVFVCVAVGFFVLVEWLIFSGFYSKASPDLPYIVVLGAQMKKNGPSIALARRLDAAAIYMNENPETVCVVSGGQGSNEPVSEAQGMYEYLVKKGMDPQRIIREDQSFSTLENLGFSRKLIPEHIQKIGIVSSNYHVYRAAQLAKVQGFAEAEGIGAGSGMYFLPNNMLREFFCVVKDWLISGMPLF